MADFKAKTLDVIARVCDVLIANEELLTELDRKIGDGDHGANVKRGCLAVKELLPSLAEAELSAVLTKCAMTLLGKVGGASGPLLAAGLLKVAKVLPHDEQTLLANAKQWFLSGVQTFADGIRERGHAEPGDKTFIDYLEPFTESLVRDYAVLHNAPLRELVQRACAAGDKGLAHTKEIVARKGRASYLGERSLGTQDPGATTVSLAMGAIAAAL